MARLDKVKESKNFEDRASSLIPVQSRPAGFFPTFLQERMGRESLLRHLFFKAIEKTNAQDAVAAKKMLPYWQKWTDYEAPGYDVFPSEEEQYWKKAKR